MQGQMYIHILMYQFISVEGSTHPLYYYSCIHW